MRSSEIRWWPFEVGPLDQLDQQDRREVAFLDAAYQCGYGPREIGTGSYRATAASGRTAEIIWRGSRRWEVALGSEANGAVSGFVSDFDCAAEAALDWLSGAETNHVAAKIQESLVDMPGAEHAIPANRDKI